MTPPRLRRSPIRSLYSLLMPEYVVSFDQSSGSSAANQPSSRISWPWNIIGMPGAVSTSAPPSVERLRLNQLPALPGKIASGTRVRPLATSSWLSV